MSTPSLGAMQQCSGFLQVEAEKAPLFCPGKRQIVETGKACNRQADLSFVKTSSVVTPGGVRS
jgi:hypothetical protein